MILTDTVAESVFSEASGVSYKQESFTINGSDKVCVNLFLVKLQAFTMNGNEEFVVDSMTESVSSLRL